ncbi:MAG: hypothetical protein Kow0013_23750 [Pararhodobacter sp.]
MFLRDAILHIFDGSVSLAVHRAAFGRETGFVHDSQDYGEHATGETKLAFSSRALMLSVGKSPPAAGTPSA